LVDDVISLLDRAGHTCAVTWLLKHHLQQGNTITDDAARALYLVLPELLDWESRLHILQMMPMLPVPTDLGGHVEANLRDGITHPNKFVRAWSYSGMYDLAKIRPELTDDVRGLFEMALRDEPPSVSARVRARIREGIINLGIVL
jgi:hypothetical protein